MPTIRLLKWVDRSTWVAPIRAACIKFEIDTVREVAAFLAQSSHESNGFRSFVENLNYSAKRLTQVWPKRFPSIAAATPYANNPQKLADKVYANRMGNGDEASGDGWTFRGSGLFQLTGRDNYARFARAVGKTPEEAAKWIRETNEGAAMSAAWFFDDHGIDKTSRDGWSRG
jgi:putative chitinase